MKQSHMPPEINPASDPTADRARWLGWLDRVAQPVLHNLAEHRLRKRMPVEAPASTRASRRQVTHLEAVGRTLTGIGPWLGCALPAGPERKLRDQYLTWTLTGLDAATAPRSPDRLDFISPGQPLVDAAFLAQGLCRAGDGLWRRLDVKVQHRIIDALRCTRGTRPYPNNWLLFAAMIEAFFASVGADWDKMRVDYALRQHQQWYKGDGAYGDGPDFHWDYYNSFVIHPMLLDILTLVGDALPEWRAWREVVATRARRYAQVQERLIAPDGSFPALGRSLTYRCGAFQALAQAAWRKNLPDNLSPGQTRAALTAVLARTLDVPGTFDSQGWLRIGLAGSQPALAENYISTGSLYLCTAALLPLGLSPRAPFWREPGQPWTGLRIWRGEDMPADHALYGP